MDRRAALVFLLMIETLVIVMLSISFYELSKDNDYKCFCDCKEEIECAKQFELSIDLRNISWEMDGDESYYEFDSEFGGKRYLGTITRIAYSGSVSSEEENCVYNVYSERIECAPEEKPSNEYDELEQKYVEGWNDGYEIGLADRPSDEEICGALIDYVFVRPMILSGTPGGIVGTHRVAYENGYTKGYSYGWNDGFTECEDFCEELLIDK